LAAIAARFVRCFAANRDFRAGFAEMVPACVGIAPFGLVCGVGAAAAGASVLGALGLSAIVFSGAAQILAVQLLATGAPLAVIVLTCFVAGLRFVIYSAAMAPYLRPLPARWQQGLAFRLTDQAFAASVRRFDAGVVAFATHSTLKTLGAGMVALWALQALAGRIG
jgi:predicted branched-subunit amino acid permease